MRSEWQEIESLRKEISRLENILARQCASIASHPQLRLGDVTDRSVDGSGNVSFEVTERNVDARKSNIFPEVCPLPNDPGPTTGETVMFHVDDEGKRFILPTGSRLILVRDEGGGNGIHVEKNESGVVSVPDGAETLSIVVAEPSGYFHGNTPTKKTGRIYPGMKLSSTDGSTKYYLCFLEGHGDIVRTLTDTVTITGASLLTLDVFTDGQGNVIDFDLDVS